MDFPAWVDDSNEGRELRDFLREHGARNLPCPPKNLELAGFFPPPSPPKLEFSAFTAPKDSFFYSGLLEAAFTVYGEAYAYIDLCTGSAIPVVSALLRWRSKGNPHALPAISLHDIDAVAVQTARTNVSALGFESRMTASVLSVADFFSRFDGGSGRVISVNPPYVPFPTVEVPNKFLAVAAGTDGLKYTRPVLDASYAPDARVVLEWSSLANPGEVIRAVRAKFEIEACYALEIGFGKYTRDPLIHDHLVKMRTSGRSLFGKRGNSESQLLIGCLLRPRKLDSP
jgi:predicted RNA methylase